ncbi:MAG TPA: cytochrome c biogenesis protein CcdA [Anaerolineales bacterium]|nr:cytochrome c biogenesis protein CcdA [Anaerolineales bacterium]HRQ91414.1 cytochrome c biogenesis protein CcdA [Anaerolineales bacterium]
MIPVPSVWLAFLAGLASFLSPCVFALVPVYVGYLSGRTAASQAKGDTRTWQSFLHGLAFVLGFSLIFILLGLFSAALGQFLFTFSRLLSQIGGIVVILFGLHLSGIYRIRWLDYELRMQSGVQAQRGYLSSAMMGVFFSAGWVPCVGPVLGSILTLAFNSAELSQGAILLGAYSAGLAIPFLIAATQVAWITGMVRRYANLSHYVERITGVLLIALGILLLSGRFQTLASLGFFFDLVEEGRVGLHMLVASLVSLLLGAGVGLWARQRGKRFGEWWFIGSGIVLLGVVLLYAVGVLRW